MKNDFCKSFPLTKVDEGKHIVYGLVTAEVPDVASEICDFDACAPLYQEWSDDALKSTTAAGQDPSLGNIRLQHTMQIAGKVTKLDIKPDAKQIWIEARPVSDAIWELIAGGYLRGFSAGGKYLWRKCEACKSDIPLEDGNNCETCGGIVTVRYAARISEVSMVDSPAVKSATFAYVKSDGSVENRAFRKGVFMDDDVLKSLASKLDSVAVDVQALKKAGDGPTKRVAGEDLKSSAFAFVGDASRTETWKFPIHFSTPEKSARHVRNALARLGQAKGIPADKKAGVKAKITAAAKKYGINVEGEEKAQKAELDAYQSKLVKAAEEKGLAKSMGSISDLASVLMQLKWVRQDAEMEAEYEFDGEGDDRDEAIAVELNAAMQHIISILKDVVEEETSELTKAATTAVKGVDMSQNDLKKAAAGLPGHFRKAADCYTKMSEAQVTKAAAHKAMMDAVGGQMSKADGEKDMVKATVSFHKAQMEVNEGMSKAYKDMAEDCKKMADDMESMAKAAEAEPDPDDKKKKEEEDEKKEAAKKAAASTQFTLDDMRKAFTDAMAAQPKALTLEDVTKAVESIVESKMEKAIVPAPAGFTLVPRPGDNNLSKSAGAFGADDVGI